MTGDRLRAYGECPNCRSTDEDVEPDGERTTEPEGACVVDTDDDGCATRQFEAWECKACGAGWSEQWDYVPCPTPLVSFHPRARRRVVS